MALAAGLVPVIYGDVTFDEVRGGTILSTEDLFSHLARALNPERILLAGLEVSRLGGFPCPDAQSRNHHAKTFSEISGGHRESCRRGCDRRHGSRKSRKCWIWFSKIPELKIQIFSGVEPGNIAHALTGETLGTWITA